jgi:hypothetical protein
VFLLDENVFEEQRVKLIRWHFRIKQIGFNIGAKGMDDREDIVPLLHALPKPTFFTSDLGFYDRKFCHHRHCIVIFRVNRHEVAEYIRQFLKHPDFNTHRKRMGWVVEIQKTNIKGMRVGRTDEFKFTW